MSTKEILDEVIIACLPCPSLQTLDRRPAIQLDGIRSKSRRVCSAESASCRHYLVAGSSTGREGACKQASAGLCWRAVAVVRVWRWMWMTLMASAQPANANSAPRWMMNGMAGAGKRTSSNTHRRNNTAARERKRRGLQQPQWPDSHQSRGDGGMQLIASNNNGHTVDITAILRARNMRWGAKELQGRERRRASRACSLLGIRRARAGQKHED